MTYPLARARVLLTRSQEDSAPLAREIRGLGGVVDCVPMITVGPAPDPAAVQEARDHVADYSWLAITSKNAATAFLETLVVPSDFRPRVAAVGRATGERIRELGWPVDLIADGKGAGALVEAISKAGSLRDAAVLYPCSQLAADEFETLAMGAGAARVRRIVCYSVTAPSSTMRAWIPRDLKIAVFASPSAAENFAGLFPDPSTAFRDISCVAIGATTCAGLERLGAQRITKAASPDTRGLIQAILASWDQAKKTERKRS